MQEKQIFKPFEKFEEGEFDKMFRVDKFWGGGMFGTPEKFHYWELIPPAKLINPKISSYIIYFWDTHYKNEPKKDFWIIQTLVEHKTEIVRKLNLNGNHYSPLHKSCFFPPPHNECKKPLESLEEAYSIIYSEISKAFLSARGKCTDILDLTFEEYFESQRARLQAKYNAALEDWSLNITPIAEQFPNL